MRILTLIFVCLGLVTCSSKKDSVTTEQLEQLDTNFELIDDFTNNKSIFRPDTFKLNDQSTDGGELIAFHTKDRDYLVIDAWLYGETGKLHVTFWTDMKINLKFAQRTNYEYDRPYYEPGYKTQETIEYYSFFDKGFRFYNSDKKEIKELGDKKKIEIEKLFTDLTEDVEIVK